MDTIYAKMLDGRETEAFSTNFALIGFESMWFINNLGTLGVILMLIPMVFLIRPLIKVCRNHNQVQRARSKLKSILYWNLPIRLMHESYILVAICCLINLVRLRWDTVWDAINSTLSLLSFFSLGVIPFAVASFLHKYKF